MKNSSPLLLLLLLLLLPLPSLTAQVTLRPLVGAAIELGGDRVGWTTDEDAPYRQIRGAQGVSVAVGGRLRHERWMLDATVGYKYWRTLDTDRHVRLTRVPLHLTAHYWLTDDWRVGLGVLTNRRIRFRADGAGTDRDYDPSYGTKLEIGWRNFALGYTRMRYYGATDRDRCAGGFGLTYLLPIGQ